MRFQSRGMVLLKGSFKNVITHRISVLYSSSRWFNHQSRAPWREDFEEPEEPSLDKSFQVKKKRSRCHSRFRPAKPSKESILVIQMLLFAQDKGQKQVETTFETRFSRLISGDMKHVFITLVKKQNFDLAFKVFERIREQAWYDPQFTAYEQLIQSYCQAEGGNKPMIKVYELLLEAEKWGLGMTRRMCQQPIKCCLAQNDFETCMKIYEMMQKSGLVKHYFFYRNIARALDRAGFVESSQQIIEDHSELERNRIRPPKNNSMERYLNKSISFVR